MQNKKVKMMKKYIVQLAAVASVVMLALNNQAEAASLHINLGKGKEKVCCAQKHKHEARHHKHKHHCCKQAHKVNRRHALVRNRKGCCHHGR